MLVIINVYACFVNTNYSESGAFIGRKKKNSGEVFTVLDKSNGYFMERKRVMCWTGLCSKVSFAAKKHIPSPKHYGINSKKKASRIIRNASMVALLDEERAQVLSHDFIGFSASR